MRKHHTTPSVPEDHNMGIQYRKKPVKSPCAGNWLIVGVFLGICVYVGLGKPNPLIEKLNQKINHYNIINAIPGIYNI